MRKVPLEYALADGPVEPFPPNFNKEDMSDEPAHMHLMKPLKPKPIAKLTAERIESQRALLGVDDSVQRVVDTLQAMGQLDNTVIVFVSDNGFSWGSHRHAGKNCAYDECMRVPLLIRYPGVEASHTELRHVSNPARAVRVLHPDVPRVGLEPTPYGV